jgi:NADPH-dependent ferric siderophore reductase
VANAREVLLDVALHDRGGVRAVTATQCRDDRRRAVRSRGDTRSGQPPEEVKWSNRACEATRRAALLCFSGPSLYYSM